MRPIRTVAALAVLTLALAACGSSSKTPAAGPGATNKSGNNSGNNSGTAGLKVPTAGMAPPTAIGKGEGSLNLIAWEGYTEPAWAKPFETQTGCKINAKYAGTSSEMVSLMANGGGG